MKKLFWVIFIVMFISLSACSQGVDNMKTLSVSLDFQRFPRQYTCDGADISPKIHVGNIPGGTKALAIIMDDPDAPVGTWVHWVAWNIIPTSTIPEAVPKTRNAVKDGISFTQGINDFHKIGYGGPCPPRGHGDHHYHIKIYALDSTLNLAGNVTKQMLEKAMKGHILAWGEAIAVYSR